jgi:hypothetical protein
MDFKNFKSSTNRLLSNNKTHIRVKFDDFMQSFFYLKALGLVFSKKKQKPQIIILFSYKYLFCLVMGF